MPLTADQLSKIEFPFLRGLLQAQDISLEKIYQLNRSIYYRLFDGMIWSPLPELKKFQEELENILKIIDPSIKVEIKEEDWENIKEEIERSKKYYKIIIIPSIRRLFINHYPELSIEDTNLKEMKEIYEFDEFNNKLKFCTGKQLKSDNATAEEIKQELEYVQLVDAVFKEVIKNENEKNYFARIFRTWLDMGYRFSKEELKGLFEHAVQVAEKPDSLLLMDKKVKELQAARVEKVSPSIEVVYPAVDLAASIESVVVEPALKELLTHVFKDETIITDKKEFEKQLKKFLRIWRIQLAGKDNITSEDLKGAIQRTWKIEEARLISLSQPPNKEVFDKAIKEAGVFKFIYKNIPSPALSDVVVAIVANVRQRDLNFKLEEKPIQDFYEAVYQATLGDSLNDDTLSGYLTEFAKKVGYIEQISEFSALTKKAVTELKSTLPFQYMPSSKLRTALLRTVDVDDGLSLEVATNTVATIKLQSSQGELNKKKLPEIVPQLSALTESNIEQIVEEDEKFRPVRQVLSEFDRLCDFFIRNGIELTNPQAKKIREIFADDGNGGIEGLKRYLDRTDKLEKLPSDFPPIKKILEGHQALGEEEKKWLNQEWLRWKTLRNIQEPILRWIICNNKQVQVNKQNVLDINKWFRNLPDEIRKDSLEEIVKYLPELNQPPFFSLLQADHQRVAILRRIELPILRQALIDYRTPNGRFIVLTADQVEHINNQFYQCTDAIDEPCFNKLITDALAASGSDPFLLPAASSKFQELFSNEGQRSAILQDLQEQTSRYRKYHYLGCSTLLRLRLEEDTSLDLNEAEIKLLEEAIEKSFDDSTNEQKQVFCRSLVDTSLAPHQEKLWQLVGNESSIYKDIQEQSKAIPPSDDKTENAALINVLEGAFKRKLTQAHIDAINKALYELPENVEIENLVYTLQKLWALGKLPSNFPLGSLKQNAAELMESYKQWIESREERKKPPVETVWNGSTRRSLWLTNLTPIGNVALRYLGGLPDEQIPESPQRELLIKAFHSKNLTEFSSALAEFIVKTPLPARAYWEIIQAKLMAKDIDRKDKETFIANCKNGEDNNLCEKIDRYYEHELKKTLAAEIDAFLTDIESGNTDRILIEASNRRQQLQKYLINVETAIQRLYVLEAKYEVLSLTSESEPDKRSNSDSTPLQPKKIDDVLKKYQELSQKLVTTIVKLQDRVQAIQTERRELKMPVPFTECITFDSNETTLNNELKNRIPSYNYKKSNLSKAEGSASIPERVAFSAAKQPHSPNSTSKRPENNETTLYLKKDDETNKPVLAVVETKKPATPSHFEIYYREKRDDKTKEKAALKSDMFDVIMTAISAADLNEASASSPQYRSNYHIWIEKVPKDKERRKQVEMIVRLCQAYNEIVKEKNSAYNSMPHIVLHNQTGFKIPEVSRKDRSGFWSANESSEMRELRDFLSAQKSLFPDDKVTAIHLKDKLARLPYSCGEETTQEPSQKLLLPRAIKT